MSLLSDYLLLHKQFGGNTMQIKKDLSVKIIIYCNLSINTFFPDQSDIEKIQFIESLNFKPENRFCKYIAVEKFKKEYRNEQDY